MTTPDGSADALVVRRLLAAPPERVFAAWLDPASLAEWMCPGSVASATAEVDPRVGGTFRITMQHGQGVEEHWGEYLAIEPPSRLAFTWISALTERRPTVVTVDLRARGAGTELILTHRRLPPTQVDAHRTGWTDIVRKLDETLSAEPR